MWLGLGPSESNADWSDPIQEETSDSDLVVRTHAAAFYVACMRAGLFDEATDFAEWYLETFDHDLET